MIVRAKTSSKMCFLLNKSATALVRDGVAEGPWVLCLELSTRVLVDGLWFCLWKMCFRGGHGVPSHTSLVRPGASPKQLFYNPLIVQTPSTHNAVHKFFGGASVNTQSPHTGPWWDQRQHPAAVHHLLMGELVSTATGRRLVFFRIGISIQKNPHSSMENLSDLETELVQ